MAKATLDKMVENGQIHKKYELNCPGCSRVLDTQNTPDNFEEEYECLYCGEEVDDSPTSYIKLQEVYGR